MATRQARLDEISNDPERPAGRTFELLCEDHNGTYLLPFFCHWREDGWHDAKTGRLIEAAVIGWRRARSS
jgi:hypothetical protein